MIASSCIVDTTVRPWHRPVAGSTGSSAPLLKARDLPVAGMFGRAFVLILFAVQVALGSIVRRSKHELQVPGEKHDETVWPSSDSGGCLSYSPDGSRVPLRGTPHFRRRASCVAPRKTPDCYMSRTDTVS